MKNLIYFLLLTFTGLSHAQSIRYHVILGPSLSWMSTNNNKINSNGSQVAFKTHVQAEYWFTDKYAVTGGIGFSLGQGGQMEYLKGGDIWKDGELSDTIFHNLPANANLGYNINLLEFIFGLKLRTNEFGKYRFYVQAPEFGINLRTKARGSIDAPSISAEDEDIRDMIRFFSLSYGFGLGLEYNISQDLTLTGGIRYFQTFTDLTSDNGRYSDGTKEDSKGILSSIDFRIGVIF
jgi:opacity protein-like surface antigen